MKLLMSLYMLGFFCFALNANAKVNPSQWDAVTTTSTHQVYHGHANKKRTLTVVSTEVPEAFPKITDAKKQIDTIQKQRKFLNNFLGYENWQISDYELKDLSSGQSLRLQGSFTDEGVAHDFYEVLYFEKDHYRQYQIVEPRGPASLKKAEAFDTIQKVAQP